MTETEFQASVERMLRARPPLLWHHCRRPEFCAGTPGLPDLIIAGPGGILLPELKSAFGDLDTGQRRWRWTLTAAGAPWQLWRPADLPTIRTKLEAIL